MRKFLFVFLMLFALSACGVFPKKAIPPPLVLSDHVLVDKIWDVRAQKFINQQQLMNQAAASEFLLLGETHDNSVHHRYQAWVIDGLRVRKRTAIVAFEMISRQQDALISDERYDSVESFVAALRHVPSHWQYDPYYIPLFERAIHAGYKIRSASLDRENIRAIGNKGEKEIPAPIKTALDYNALSSDHEAALRKEIVGSHCGMDHEGMVSAMMLTQRVKDAVMMDSLIGNDAVETKVLVAGSGHARKDWGVPKYIVQSRPNARIVSMAWLEVLPDMINVVDYAQRWGGEALPFDYVWFTPRADRPDPCEQFRRHMEKRHLSTEQRETKSKTKKEEQSDASL